MIKSGTPSESSQPTCHVGKDLRREIHLSLQQANTDYRRKHFNTVVSAAMKMLNTLERVDASNIDQIEKGALQIEGFSILLKILFPIVPHVTEALWMELDFTGELEYSPWPQVDEAALEQDEIELVVQVNGKLRAKIKVAADATEEKIKEIAFGDEIVQNHIKDKPLKKFVVVPGRLVNIVV